MSQPLTDAEIAEMEANAKQYESWRQFPETSLLGTCIRRLLADRANVRAAALADAVAVCNRLLTLRPYCAGGDGRAALGEARELIEQLAANPPVGAK